MYAPNLSLQLTSLKSDFTPAHNYRYPCPLEICLFKLQYTLPDYGSRPFVALWISLPTMNLVHCSLLGLCYEYDPKYFLPRGIGLVTVGQCQRGWSYQVCAATG